MIFGVFVGEMGKNNFGYGDKVRSLQNSSWGKVGSSLDAFLLCVWMDQNDKELKRARENKNPLQTGENI